MAQAPLSSAEIERRLAALGARGGNQCDTALDLGLSLGALRNTLHAARLQGIPIPDFREAYGVANHPGRIDLEVDDGIVLVGSDAHIWPGEPTPAMRAFQFAIASMASDIRAVILNGDVFDGASISRHPSIGWEKRPTVVEELGACQQRLAALQRAARGAEMRWLWNLGNHDMRFEMKIANGLPELADVQGVHLKDHFPDWEPAWSTWINNSVVVKHRFKGGIHAAFNNAKESGKSIVTGHLHRLQAIPWTDYNGTRWGVETGTLAQPYGPQFIHYTEGNPVNWRAGFAILRFSRGELMMPELVMVRDEHHWEYQGKVYEG